jgi:hypothetical protein
MNYPFTNKEEYLAYRQMWKAEYKELSNQIRGTVIARKQYQKAWSKAEKEAKIPGLDNRYNYQKIYQIHKEILKNDPIYQKLAKMYNPTNYQYWRYPDKEKLRKTAIVMLEELKEAKQEAQRQYLTQHEELCKV